VKVLRQESSRENSNTSKKLFLTLCTLHKRQPLLPAIADAGHFMLSALVGSESELDVVEK